MGRYYYGDIQGKFWFAIQSSDDATYFGIEPEYIYEFLECGCPIEIYDESDPRLTDQLFCGSCYDSLEEHREKADLNQTWFLRELSYHYTVEDLSIVERKCTFLSRQVGKYMTNYKISSDKTNGYTYDYTIPEDANKTITPTQRIEIARLCLGKLIHHCLSETGTCHFFAEI